MLPTYNEIKVPLIDELTRRGGQSRPTDKDSHGRTVYQALAEHFRLSKADLEEQTSEGRSKFENMVRYAVRSLRDEGEIVKGTQGVWVLKRR